MFETIFALLLAQLGWELKREIRAVLWEHRWTIVHVIWSLLCVVVPVVFKASIIRVLTTIVLPACKAWWAEVFDSVDLLFGSMWEAVTFSYRKRKRMRQVYREATKRTQRVLDILDMDDLGGDEMELVARKQYIRCAVLISRRARMGLKYPGHSKANEKIAADWILRHLPDNMTMGVRHKVLPLAVKLTFVRSHYEYRADSHFSMLGDMVDVA